MPSTGRRVALVTGASRGIGRACAHALADSGLDVAVTARTRTEGTGIDDSDVGAGASVEGSLERTAAEVEQRGVDSFAVVADLLDHDSLRAAVAQTGERFGRLDVLVLNAVHTGAGSMLRLADTTPEMLTTKLMANVVAQLVLVQAALPLLSASGDGRVISMTSYAATHEPTAPVGSGGWGYAYAASKAAFHRLAGHVAVEYGDAGIVAVNVDPGHVLTERMRANAERLGLEGRYSGAPPSAPAAAVAWLATSSEASALDGQTVSGLKLALEKGLHPDWR
ncbi:MAG TPA: SDR family NAD(P)-dependent oxidoreductase [Mycobacteriales bacterium]|nr:SDR family NAD(P)-dependent oxidoreductase [Mycobacteriales bacterium]